MTGDLGGEADIAVVGVGLAGLAAARDVIATGRSLAVPEALERVDGRLHHRDIGDEKVVEIEGQRAGPAHRRVLARARDLGGDTFPTIADGENLVELDGQIRRYRSSIPRINHAVLAALKR